MCTTIDDHGRVCVEVTREDGSHCTIALSTYESVSAQIVRSVTARQPVVWSPETGWTDPVCQ